MSLLRRWLVAGLLIWLPLMATYLVIRLLVRAFDQTLLLLPPDLRPEALLGFNIPGLGVVLSLAVLLGTGAVVANFAGRRAVGLGERILERIPLVRSIYTGVKRLTHAVMADDSQTFRRVVLIEYPRTGIWTLAFQTGDPDPAIVEATGTELMTIYVPTTPNPTSGFVMFVPRDAVRVLEMPVEVALKMIMTLGVVTSEEKGAAPAPAVAAGSPTP